MDSMRDIKTRIKSVESTMQITKALELVAASKLKGSREKAESAKPYFRMLEDIIADIRHMGQGISSVFMHPKPAEKACYMIIAGDRGLAGGYNNNIYKTAEQFLRPQDAVLPIGKKSLEYYAYHHADIVSTAYAKAAAVSNADCMDIAQQVTRLYTEHAVDAVYLIYTQFVTVLTHVPHMIKLLPLDAEERKNPAQLTIYEPSAEAVLDSIVPQYIGGILFGALAESIASELASRRIAMESANHNAEEIIDQLSLQYNRARQASITQELTEIMSAAAEQA